jgi:hypothetical protein
LRSSRVTNMPESTIQNQIMFALGSRPDVRIFRNNVGNGYVGRVLERKPGYIVLKQWRRIQYGLDVGSSDLVGMKSVVVTPDMVGQRVAVFLSPEVKKPGEGLHGAQADWRDMVLAMGGIAGAVHSVEEAGELVGAPQIKVKGIDTADERFSGDIGTFRP